MLRKILLAAAALVAVIAVIAGIKVVQIRSMISAGESFTMPPEAVSSAVARRVEWTTSDRAVGSIAAVQGVLIRSEVAGLVEKIAFESGADVRQGDVLVVIDAAAEEAQLAAARARAELARANLKRARELHEEKILSRSELDAREAEFKEMTGDDEAIRVAIAKKVIKAPFSGRVGIRKVQLGQLVEQGTEIVTLQAIDPVHVNFTLPEQAAPRITEGMKVIVATDATPDRRFEGRLTAVSPAVDPTSRHLELQATLPNPDGAVLPGMSAGVEVLGDARVTPIVVPATSVLRAPYGDSVFVLEEVKDEKGVATLRARMTTVTLGESRGDLVAIEKGLEEGDVVASSGVFKLTNGAAVAINNDLAPAAVEKPQPSES